MRIDRMLWIQKDDLYDIEELKSMLTVRVEHIPYSKKITRIQLWEDDGDSIGVPRMWGLQNSDRYRKFYLKSDIQDRCVRAEIDWPKIEFPDCGYYWKGQEEAIKDIYASFVEDKRYGALLEAPCGSGKTLLAVSVAAKMNQKVLVIVHKEDLATEWWKTVRIFFSDAKLGHVQQNTWSYENKHLVTAVAQTLYARRNKIPQKFWDNFGMTIYDECHRFPTSVFEKVMRMSKSRYRLGVSATWRRADGLDYIWNWHIGEIEHRMRSDRLVGRYKLCLWNTNLSDKMFTRNQIVQNARFISAVAKNDLYNNWLADQIIKAVYKGRKILGVGARISQLTCLRTLMINKKSKFSIGLYVGSLNGKKISSEQLENAKQCEVILATFSKINEGTDIPDLDTLFMLTPRTDVEQIVGRIQRKYEGKKELLIVDPVFSTDYMRNLGNKRERIYRKLGFECAR